VKHQDSHPVRLVVWAAASIKARFCGNIVEWVDFFCLLVAPWAKVDLMKKIICF